MLQSGDGGENRIVRRYIGSDTEGGLHQARSSGSGAARAAGRAAGSRARSARSEAAHASSGSALHYARIHSAKEAAGLGAQDVGIGDGQVVARNRQVEIVLQRQSDGILQRNVKLAIAHELLQPW